MAIIIIYFSKCTVIYLATRFFSLGNLFPFDLYLLNWQAVALRESSNVFERRKLQNLKATTF